MIEQNTQPTALSARGIWARLEKVSFFLFITSVVVMVLAFGPTSYISLGLVKMVLGSVGIGLSLLALLVYSIVFFKHDRPSRAPLARSGIFVALCVPVAYGLSWWMGTRPMGLIGSGVDVDTLVFVVMAALAAILGLTLVHSEKRARTVLRAVLGSIGVAVIFQIMTILSAKVWLPGAADVTATLVGKLNELGLLSAYGILALLATLTFGERSHRIKTMVMIGLVFSVAFLFVIDFDVAWYVVLGGVVVLALMQRCLAPAGETETVSLRRFSLSGMKRFVRTHTAYVILAVFAILGIFGGDYISTHAPAPLSIPTIEVRPSLSTTLSVANAAHQGSAQQVLFGAGPNTFKEMWIVHKPLSVNLTQFWSTDFVAGYSTLITAFASVGVVGVLAWILPLLLMLAVFMNTRRIIRSASPRERSTYATLFVLSLASWAGVALYATGPVSTLLLFVTFGSFIGYSVAFGHVPSRAPSPAGKIAGVVFLICLVVLGLAASAMLTRRLVSETYTQLAAAALSASDLQNAAAYQSVSEKVEMMPDNMRVGMFIDYALLQKLATMSTTPDTIDQVRQQFQAIFQDAVVHGRKVAELDPGDYRSYVSIAQLYEMLITLKVPGADAIAKQMYEQAAQLNPTNPAIPLLLARLEASVDVHANLDSVRQALMQSIQLKGNYTDAYVLGEQIAISLNDLSSAVAAAQAAVQTSPQDPQLWFQLGLLYYAGNDMSDASKALEQAIILAPNHQYANAEYFLGVAYTKLGRVQEAYNVFSDIAKTNPDNATIKQVLSALSAGKDPFPAQAAPKAAASQAPAQTSKR